MTMLRTCNTGLLCALALLAGCGQRGGDYAQSIRLREDVVGIGRSLVMITETSKKALVLDLNELGATPKLLELPSNPALLVKRNEADEALVLCSGQRGTAEEDAAPSVLEAISPDGSRREYVLGSPFDTLAQSDDGRYAIAYRTSSSDRLLGNPNVIAVVDLDADPDDGDAVHNRTLDSLSETPTKVLFSPTMNILGEDRRLAVVLSTRNVTLIDLAHLDRAATTVQLSQALGSAASPTQVVFSTRDPVLYVRGATADDLFAFDLTARPGGFEDEDGGLHNDFRPTINQLGVGARPSDMALYDTSDGARLLTLTDSGLNLAVVNTSTGQATGVPLTAHAESLIVFEAPSPRDDSVAQRALLYDIDSAAMTFVDLEDIEERKGRNLDTISLAQTVLEVVPMLAESVVLAIHTQGISLIDLASRTVSPITSNSQLEDALFDQAGRRFWVGPKHQPWVGTLDLETGTTGEVLLDAPIGRLVPLFDSGLLAVVHPSDVGHVTVLDLDAPDRKNARAVRGFLLAAALERGEP